MKVKSLESRVESQKSAAFALAARDSGTRPSDPRPSTRPPSARHDAHRAAGRDRHPHDARGGGDSAHVADERRPPAPRSRARAQHVHHRRPDPGHRAPPAVGVALKRLSQDTKQADDNGVRSKCSTSSSPPYAGFDANSRACVAIHPTIAAWTGAGAFRHARHRPTTGLPVGWTADLFPTRHDPAGRCDRDQRHAVRAATDTTALATLQSSIQIDSTQDFVL